MPQAMHTASGQEDQFRDTLPKKYRDLKVDIITRADEIEITGLVFEISLYEAIDSPFIHGQLKFADNSGLVSALPIIGQEDVRIKFTRRGHTVDRTFACTGVTGIKKVSGDSAGVVLTLTSKKHLTNAVSTFSKSYSGLASDIIDKIHFNNFGEHIDIKSNSGSAHNIVFPFTKPYAAINTVMGKTFGEDGTPYFLFENLFGDKPILQSLKSMVDATPVTKLKELSQTKATNKDVNGQSTRYVGDSLGVLYDYEIDKNSDSLNMLSGGALINNTIRLNISNNEYSENSFKHALHAKTIADLDPYKFYTVDGENLASSALKPSLSVEMYNPVAFESDGVTELSTQAGTLSLTMAQSHLSRMNDMISISAYTDSDPENYKVGLCVNLIVTPNRPALDGDGVAIDTLFSGTYLIARLRHYIKDDNYTMSMELIRDGLSIPTWLQQTEQTEY